MEESHLSVQTFVRQIWREKTKQNSEIQINPGSVKTRKKKKRKIRIIVSLLLTRNAERVHNIPLTHFDLQLHLYNFSFPAGCNCSPLKKKKECSWDREWKKNPKNMSENNKAEHRLDSLRPLINSSAASDHLTRCAYSRQMPPAISLQPNFIHQCSSQRLLLHDRNHFTLRIRGVRIKK